MKKSLFSNTLTYSCLTRFPTINMMKEDVFEVDGNYIQNYFWYNYQEMFKIRMLEKFFLNSLMDRVIFN